MAQATAVPSGGWFSNTVVGTTDTISVQVRNNGSTSYTITGTSITGPGFHFANLSTPIVVNPGGYHSFSLEFSPTTATLCEGVMAIQTTASDSVIKIYLGGTGIAIERTLSASPSSLSFSKESTGTSESLPVTLKNTGNSTVRISGITLSSSQLGSSGSVVGATLSAGQSANLNVIYSPTTAGNFSGQVKISSNASNSPDTINVTGSAFVPTTNPSVSLSWNASSSSGIEGYFVYRSTSSGGTYTKLNASYLSGLSYTDDAVVHGDTYYYAVSTVSSSGVEGAKCPPDSIKVP